MHRGGLLAVTCMVGLSVPCNDDFLHALLCNHIISKHSFIFNQVSVLTGTISCNDLCIENLWNSLYRLMCTTDFKILQFSNSVYANKTNLRSRICPL